ncbi:MAG: hypothetical protein H0U90_03070 [Actinobacteria bacterium]|nr:hypothetical protein [Actinomycetota bacterium]
MDAANLRVNARGVATVDYLKNGRWRAAVVRGRRVRYGRGAPGADVTVPTSAVAVPMIVALRVGPSGRFWALQVWQRIKGGQVELRLSRWRGAPTKLELWTHCCKWRSEIVRGRATFHGRPIFGYRSTPSGVPLDGLGRNVYIDSWRNGRWQRLMGILTHRPTGRFGLWIRPYWRGSQYAARMVGPNWGRTLAPDAFACCPQTRLR